MNAQGTDKIRKIIITLFKVVEFQLKKEINTKTLYCLGRYVQLVQFVTFFWLPAYIHLTRKTKVCYTLIYPPITRTK